MRDNEIDDLDLPPDDLDLVDPLDEDFDEVLLAEHPPTNPSLSREEIDEMIDRTLDEELSRLRSHPPKKD